MANTYSDDFYRFIQPDILSILGKPNESAVKDMVYYKTSGALNAFMNNDPSEFTILKNRTKKTGKS